MTLPGPTRTASFFNVGEYRAVPGGAHFQDDVGRVLDVDDLVAREERLRTLGRQIGLRVFRIDRLDEQILRVGVGGREAPGDMIVLSEQHARRAGHGRAFDRKLRA